MSSKMIGKTYEPQDVEKKWYAFWEENKCFHADPASTRPPYSIVIPPPNVTGVLHMGHALNNTLQDVLARWKRMTGYEVLWMPGTDHAGIATQNVVEKQLARRTETGMNWAGKNLSSVSGNGGSESGGRLSISSNAWGLPATGNGNGSPWTRACHGPCGRFSSRSMKMA